MFKIIYLPTAEEVELYEEKYYSKDALERYMGRAYYFFRKSNVITISSFGGGRFRGRRDDGRIIPKHLLEIIEVGNV